MKFYFANWFGIGGIIPTKPPTDSVEAVMKSWNVHSWRGPLFDAAYPWPHYEGHMTGVTGFGPTQVLVFEIEAETVDQARTIYNTWRHQTEEIEEAIERYSRQAQYDAWLAEHREKRDIAIEGTAVLRADYDSTRILINRRDLVQTIMDKLDIPEEDEFRLGYWSVTIAIQQHWMPEAQYNRDDESGDNEQR